MKVSALLIAASLACAASAPAYGQAVHQTTMAHDGRTFTVTYQPQVETRLRDVGHGPRSSPSCRWTSVLSVQRTTLDAQQRPVAALTRVVETGKQRSGTRLGACASFAKGQLGGFGNSRDLHGQVARVAARDADDLRTEFASLSAIHATAAHAR